MVNANTACDWLCAAADVPKEVVLAQHFVGVTARLGYAQAFGLRDENIFGIWGCGRRTLFILVSRLVDSSAGGRHGQI